MIARIRTTATFPASLILSSREQKQYRRYQSQTSSLTPQNQGKLPTAIEYADFQSWLAKRDSGYLSDTPIADIAYYVERAAANKNQDNGKASVCGHTLHPAHKAKAERCPVCIVEAHVNYMKALTVAVGAAGGLVEQRWEASDKDAPATQAWYAAKLQALDELNRLEVLAERERDYDKTCGEKSQQGRFSSQTIGERKTAIEAVQMYWNSIDAFQAAVQSPRSKKKASKVVFCSETSFEPGRDQLYFWRKSPRYEAGGKYASLSVSSDDDEEDEIEDEEQGQIKEQADTLAMKNMKSAPTPRTLEIKEEDEASDLEEDDDDSSDEEDDDDFESDDDDDDDLDDTEDTSFVVFEYEEVVVQGAEFILFED